MSAREEMPELPAFLDRRKRKGDQGDISRDISGEACSAGADKFEYSTPTPIATLASGSGEQIVALSESMVDDAGIIGPMDERSNSDDQSSFFRSADKLEEDSICASSVATPLEEVIDRKHRDEGADQACSDARLNDTPDSPEERIARAGARSDHFSPARPPRYPSRFGLLAWNQIDFEVKGKALVKGLLTEGGFSVIYGDSGSGKTYFAADLGLHIAGGLPWFGRKVMLGGVVYIAAEGGLSMRRRVVGYRHRHGLRKDERIPFALIPSPVNLLDGDADLPELLELMQRVASERSAPLRLIIIDTLSRVIAGGNENASEDMGRFVRNVDQLREKTGAHVSVVHHSGKNPSAGARGHSLLKAAADTEVEVNKTEGGVSIARVVKQRDGADGDTFSFKLHPVELDQDEDGEPITTCVVLPVQDESPVRSNKRTKPLSAEAQSAVGFLSDTITDLGQPLGRPGMPSLKAVTLEQWRDRLKQRGLYDSDDKGRQEFRRMKKRLISEKQIAIDGDLVWRVPGP
jgi:hypothetical protein